MKPAFTAATGAGFSGTGNSSGTLSSDIVAGEISPNVFESVGGDNITPLEPKFTKWYIPYAGTSMVHRVQPEVQVRERVQGLRRRLQAAQHPVLDAAADARPQARPHRPEHRPAGPRLHLHAGARAEVLPPALGHGVEDPRHQRLRHLEARARSTPSPRSTPPSSPASSTRPARSSPRRSSCTWTTSRCRRRSTSATPRSPRPTRRRRVKLENGMTKSGSPQVIDITTDRHADPGRDRVHRVHAVAGRPGAVQGGGVHADHAHGRRRQELRPVGHPQ